MKHISDCIYNLLWPEMGIYRDSLSAIVIGDNFLPTIVIAQNSFDLTITDITFVFIAINYREKRLSMQTA